MDTLGQKLAQNLQRERLAATDLLAAAEQLRTDAEHQAFQTGKVFFDNAKIFFNEKISNAAPSNDLFLQVGGRRFAPARLNCHQQFDMVLAGYQCKNQKLGPDSLFNGMRLSALWLDFQKWADDSGLVASWHYCWSGGGEDSWWQLKVQPKASLMVLKHKD